jgi:hypothetical protein
MLSIRSPPEGVLRAATRKSEAMHRAPNVLPDSSDPHHCQKDAGQHNHAHHQQCPGDGSTPGIVCAVQFWQVGREVFRLDHHYLLVGLLPVDQAKTARLLKAIPSTEAERASPARARSAAEGLRPVKSARITTGQREASLCEYTINHVGAVTCAV